MSTQHLNSLIIAGYPQQDTSLIKQAGYRITTARKQFGNLCGADIETAGRGGTIGRTMKERIAGPGMDMGKEEDINNLCSLIGKAHYKMDKAVGELMKAWDDWDMGDSKIGRSSEVTEKKIEALTALHAWGAWEAAKELLRMKKSETYLEKLILSHTGMHSSKDSCEDSGGQYMAGKCSQHDHSKETDMVSKVLRVIEVSGLSNKEEKKYNINKDTQV